MAHSAHKNRTNTKSLLPNLQYFKSLGLDGVEAYYFEFSQREHEMLLKYAGNLNIAVCGGSAFYGDNQPDISLGKGRGSLAVPEGVYDVFCKYLEKSRCS